MEHSGERGQMATFFGAGAFASFAAYGLNTLGSKQMPDLLSRSGFGYGFTSITSPLISYGVADFSSNLLNYYGGKGKWPKKINDVYSNGFKSLFKLDFYSGSSFFGFGVSNRAFRGLR